MQTAPLVTDCAARVKQFERLMYQRAHQLLNFRKEDAEDAFAEARLKFLKRCQEGTVEDRGIGAFLKTLVWGTCTDIIRDRKGEVLWGDINAAPDQPFPIEQIADPNPGPGEIAVGSDFSEKIVRCLESLSADQKEVILAVHAPDDDRSYAEVVALLGISLAKVRTRLSSARKLLRLCLEKETATS